MTEELKKEYIEKHLPYRINSLLSPDLITHRRLNAGEDKFKLAFYSDSLTLEPSFEISIIFGRALLHFLGIGYDFNRNILITHQPKKDDFTIKSLYPERGFCPLDDNIVKENERGLITIIKEQISGSFNNFLFQ